MSRDLQGRRLPSSFPVMHAALLGLLLTLQTPDTVVRLHGFVLSVPLQPSAVHLVLAYPLRVRGVAVGAVVLSGDAERWARYIDRYVEAQGRIVAPDTLAAAQLREAA